MKWRMERHFRAKVPFVGFLVFKGLNTKAQTLITYKNMFLRRWAGRQPRKQATLNRKRHTQRPMTPWFCNIAEHLPLPEC